MASQRHTIFFRDSSGVTRKLTKVVYGADGSYYVVCPYHDQTSALITRRTVNYALREGVYPLAQALEVGSLHDDEQRLKLSHHPDGFIQFSGEGILSGREQDGSPKGIGLVSWPLTSPVPGPSFGLAIHHVEQFRQGVPSEHDCVFDQGSLALFPGFRILVLEGFYLHPFWRRFVEGDESRLTIRLNHPSGVSLPLRVLLPPVDCALQGFIAVGIASIPPDTAGGESFDDARFFLSSSTGNLRRDKYGQLLGDSLNCMYPCDASLAARLRARDLNYRHEDLKTKVEPGIEDPIPLNTEEVGPGIERSSLPKRKRKTARPRRERR